MQHRVLKGQESIFLLQDEINEIDWKRKELVLNQG